MVFVTGATGFLGSYLVRYLVREGFRVRALKRSASDLSLLAEAADKVEWAEGDVLDIASLEEAMRSVEKVYHLASMVSFNPAERSKMMKVNVEGCANVVNVALAAGVKKFLYAGSSSAFGKSETNELIDENADWDKNTHETHYSISKMLGEQEVWRGMAEGLNAVITNPTLLLGAGRWADSSVRLIEAVAQGQLFYPVGSTGYLDVRDAAKAMLRLMDSDISGERFIINAENLKFKEAIRLIAAQLGVKPPTVALNKWVVPLGRVYDAARAFLTRQEPVFTSEVAKLTFSDFRYDNSKIQAALNFSFTPVHQTITETTEQYKLSKKTGKTYAVLAL